MINFKQLPYNVLNLDLGAVQVGSKKIHDQIRLLGLDCANSYVKMSGDFGELVYPNTVKTLNAKEKKLYIRETGVKKLEHKDTDEIIFTYEDRDYLIGTADRDSVESLDRDFDRHSKDNYKRNFILAVSRIANNGDNFIVCTGVPSFQFTDDEVVDSFKRLHGTYTVKRDGVDVTFKISYVYVELEPRGTYLSTVYELEDHKVFVKNKDILESKYVGILDSGYGTTDYAGFVKDSRGHVKLENVESVKFAMSDAYAKLKANLFVDYQTIDKMPLIEIEKELRVEKMLQPSGVVIPKEDLDAEVKKAFEETAENILKDLKSKVDTDSLNYLIYTGGGMVTLKDYFKEGLDGNFITASVKEPQIANARGYLIRLYILNKVGQLQELINEGGNN